MYNKALVLKHMGKKEEAIIDFKKILISEPEDYEVRLQIAKIYLEENQFELTAYYLDSILGFDSNNTVALYFKGKLLERQGNYEASIKLLEYEHLFRLESFNCEIVQQIRRSLKRYIIKSQRLNVGFFFICKYLHKNVEGQ
ncbi:tetratricopeptide repeat protein [Paenibacillus pabuli]|uniref:Tetratricopeptide repeat protein n=1 Tax=Paenibacillus pabuli TaxID=1472 RepID=A0A855XTC7_9BACL|nr:MULTISPECIES: hypothetical protein [Paenibacillus]PWW38906.1 tetratricopeptide repeat protein [Paenibacillus pabuli]PXW06091.1 tetratricopeptide repeat protein [Paenibacillus taichungensis]